MKSIAKKKTKEFQNNKLNLSNGNKKSSNNKNSKNRNYERNDDKMHCYIRNLGSSIFAAAATADVVAFSQKRAIALNNTMPLLLLLILFPFLSSLLLSCFLSSNLNIQRVSLTS
jgi:hypothetical protein